LSRNSNIVPYAMSCHDIEYLARRFRAARIIQRAFRLAIVNPEYNMCRNRLIREFECLNKANAL